MNENQNYGGMNAGQFQNNIQGQEVEGGDEFSFSQLGISCPGGRIISSTGPIVNYDVEKFRMKKQTVARISFINEEFFQISTHWHPNTKSFFCTNGYCCAKLGRSIPRKYGLIVNYKNIDQRGNIIGNMIDYTLEMIQLGNKNYEALDSARTASDLSNRNSGYDLIVRCTDEKFQTYQFQAIPKKAAWLFSETLRKEIFCKLQEYGDTVTKCIGSVIPEAKIKELLDAPVKANPFTDPGTQNMNVNNFHSYPQGQQQHSMQQDGGQNITPPENIDTDTLFI